MKKRIAAVLLSITLALGMTACGAGKADPASAPPEASVPSDSVPEASVPSEPAPEASTPDSASEEQPQGGAAGIIEALLEKYEVKDFPEYLCDFQIAFVGGIKDGQEYNGYSGYWEGDELYREVYDTPGTILSLSVGLGAPYRADEASCSRIDPEGEYGWFDGTWRRHPDNDKFLELLLPDATGEIISYTLMATEMQFWESDDPLLMSALILFRTDGKDGNVQFFSMVCYEG